MIIYIFYSAFKKNSSCLRFGNVLFQWLFVVLSTLVSVDDDCDDVDILNPYWHRLIPFQIWWVVSIQGKEAGDESCTMEDFLNRFKSPQNFVKCHQRVILNYSHYPLQYNLHLCRSPLSPASYCYLCPHHAFISYETTQKQKISPVEIFKLSSVHDITQHDESVSRTENEGFQIGVKF